MMGSGACAFAIVAVSASQAVSPGYVYEVTVSSNITLTLPAQATAGGVPLVIKRVSSGVNTITVVPAAGEFVNGMSGGQGLNQQGQGQWFWPGAPTGPAAGTGWMSY